jgi:hypothetical protein
MRIALFAGLILTAFGAFALIKGIHYSTEESVFKFGGLEAKVQQQRRMPDWIGGIALGAGVVLMGAGLKKR